MTSIPVSKLPVLIPIKVGGKIIEQRNKDGYIDATAMCQVAGKKFAGYYRLDSTQAFLRALSTDVQIHTSVLVQSIKGGNDKNKQGTFVHPRVAIHLAQWLSPEFAVLVSGLVFNWLSAAPAREKWDQQSKKTRIGRKQFFNIIEPRTRSWNKRGVAMCTDAMNRAILDCTAKEFKVLKNLKDKDLNRDIMSENELLQFELAEQTAGEIIIDNNIYDKARQKGKCYQICKETAQTIHEAITSLKARQIVKV